MTDSCYTCDVGSTGAGITRSTQHERPRFEKSRKEETEQVP